MTSIILNILHLNVKNLLILINIAKFLLILVLLDQ